MVAGGGCESAAVGEEADVADPDGSSELQDVGLDVLGGEDGRGRVLQVPESEMRFAPARRQLGSLHWAAAECEEAVPRLNSTRLLALLPHLHFDLNQSEGMACGHVDSSRRYC